MHIRICDATPLWALALVNEEIPKITYLKLSGRIALCAVLLECLFYVLAGLAKRVTFVTTS